MTDIRQIRIEKLRNYLSWNNMDSALVTDLKNVFYFSGYTGTSAYLLITLDKLYLVTDFRYITQASEQCPLFEIIDVAKGNISSLCETVICTGFENLSIGYNEYQKFSNVFKELKPLDKTILNLRAKKSSDEIQNIKKAVEIADNAFLHILKFAKSGMSEIEVANEIDYFMKKNGAEKNSFDTICASGVRGALPHGFPTDKKLERGELTVIDFGCVYNGYCSDITRCFAVGEISDELQKVYDTVLNAQLCALEAAVKGNVCADIHNKAQEIIDKNYKGYFGHSLGHGVGLDIHEEQNLSPKNFNVLEEGNVVTVEPGIYIPDFCGVRIEDMIYISDYKTKILTQSPKELYYIE